MTAPVHVPLPAGLSGLARRTSSTTALSCASNVPVSRRSDVEEALDETSLLAEHAVMPTIESAISNERVVRLGSSIRIGAGFAELVPSSSEAKSLAYAPAS